MARPAEPEKRRDLARRAVAVLEREGLEISTSRLAKALGVKRPTLLYHFPSLSHIVELALEDLLTEQAAYVLPRIAEHAHPIDQLHAQLCAVHEFHRGREQRVVFLSQAIAATAGKRMKDIIDVGNRVFEPYRQAMADRLRQGIREGTVAPCDVEAVMALVRAVTDGLMVQRVMTGLDLEPVHELLWQQVLGPLKKKNNARQRAQENGMTNAFPEKGIGRQQILERLGAQKTGDLPSDGRAFAFVYDAGDELRGLAREAFAACMTINGLDPTVYPSARRIESQVVHAALELLNAPEGAVGTATAGGTESVMLAVKSARDFSRGRTKQPKMLLPQTAHACFHKAAHYLGVEVVVVDVDPVTFRADVDDARAKMSEDVILVVGSAPSYAHGVIDPITELAALAKEHGVLMHVDACVGGCVLPFMRDNGVDVTPFDFQVDGVTSISLDLHKYGFAPKGISILLQRRRELRDAQYYACANWTGYAIVNSTTLGSKSVAAMGAASAVIEFLGRDGYRARTKLMWDATKKLVATIQELDGVHMVGAPDMNLFAFTTDEGDVFELADRLTECGWHVQPTYAYGRSPAHIHLTLDPGNAARVDAFIADLKKSVVDLPPTQAPPEGVVAMLEQIGAGADGIDAGALMAELGITDGQLPERSGMIHRLINAASPPARERLLVLFIGELFS